jgi:RNA polymerase sigma-70 factor (ECF subfamily)
MADAERSLVRELKQRRRQAWAELYDRQASDLLAFIVHLLHGDRAAGEEIHQNVWLAALAGIEQFDDRQGELRAWLFGIARRQVALHFRRLGQRRTNHAGREFDLSTSADDAAILPLDVLGAIERSDAVRAALVELGADDRAVLLGKYVEGQSVEQLAQRLERTPKAIESLLSRARAKLRALLGPYFDTEDVLKDAKS